MDIKDILLSNENELQTLRGDFLVGDSDAQHVQHIIEATKGNFLENPTIGVNIAEYRNGNISLADLTKRVRLELQKDGYRLYKVYFVNEEIVIDAQRIKWLYKLKTDKVYTT